jgi:hypothetical protein
VVLPALGPPGTGKERPDINVTATTLGVNQGEVASTTGSFSNIDGGAVTLASSVGTVTPTGGGNFSWSFPTGTGNSRFVYLTATNASGIKAQIPFQLNIANAAPAVVVPAAQTVGQGNALTFGVTATDANAVDTLSLSASGLPAGLTFKDNGDRTGTVSGTATGPPGASVVTFTASDGHHDGVSATLPVTVTAPILGPPAASAVLTPLVGATERLTKRGHITVGCQLSLPTLQRCAAAVARRGQAVGQGAKILALTGRAATNVAVTLDQSTQSRVGRSLGGVPVTVALSALPFGSVTPLAATAATRVVPGRIVATTRFGNFTDGSSEPTGHTTRYLEALAKKVGTARRVICVAHPDRGSNSRALAKARATAACAVLEQAGLQATFGRVGSRSTHNHRVAVTIIR